MSKRVVGREPLPPLPDGRVLVDAIQCFTEAPVVELACSNEAPGGPWRRLAVTPETWTRWFAVQCLADITYREIMECQPYTPEAPDARA